MSQAPIPPMTGGHGTLAPVTTMGTQVNVRALAGITSRLLVERDEDAPARGARAPSLWDDEIPIEEASAPAAPVAAPSSTASNGAPIGAFKPSRPVAPKAAPAPVTEAAKTTTFGDLLEDYEKRRGSERRKIPALPSIRESTGGPIRDHAADSGLSLIRSMMRRR